MDELVSIVIPYQQDRGYLRQAVESVERQTYKHWEIIHAKGPGTVGENMNSGIERARGIYIKKLDEDDLLTPNCLEDSVRGIGSASFLYGDAIDWNMANDTRKIYSYGWTTFDEMIKCNRIHGGSIFYRRDVLLDIGGYDEGLITGEEYDLNLKILKWGHRGVYINSNLYIYRIHEGNKSMVSRIGTEDRKDYIDKIRDKYV